MPVSRSADGSRRLSFTALIVVPLLMSCGDAHTRPTEPSADDVASLNRTATPKPIFAVEPSLMTVPTYDGSGQSVHPDVVAFDSEWHGAKFWMTMTPYPKSNQALENPS